MVEKARRGGWWVLMVGVLGCGMPLGGGAVDMGEDGARPLTCYDAMKSGDETDVDCGGSCVPCGFSQACKRGTDCDSGFCTNLVCDAATCTDGVKNGIETDVDCGAVCGACGLGKTCSKGMDCISTICTNSVCSKSPCVDGLKNGAETDVDCGGPTCGKCPGGKACTTGTDCQSGTCTNNVCKAACPMGTGDCDNDMQNGCETATVTDPKNCGTCGHPCPSNTPACSGGMCVSVLCPNGLSFSSPASFPAGSGPVHLVTSDFDGDGKLDILAALQGSDQVSVLINNGGGMFAMPVVYPATSQPRVLTLGDVTGDGTVDVVVGSTSAKMGILPNQGNGVLGAITTCGAYNQAFSVAVGDLNGDGAADVVTADYGTDKLSVYFNPVSAPPDLGIGDGGGGALCAFSNNMDYVVGVAPLWVQMVDMNGDGKKDLVTSGATSNVGVLINQGTGFFAPRVDYPTGGSAHYMAIADVSGDGKPDVVIANNLLKVATVLLNTNGGALAQKVDYPAGQDPFGVAIGDLDGDGKPDLVVADLSQSVQVLLNKGSGTFGAPANFLVNSATAAVTLGDYDGDGKLDIAIATSPGVRILFNRCQ